MSVTTLPSSTPDGNSPFALVLPSTTFVSGGTLDAHFALDLQKAQALGLTSVRVQLRGTANTAIFGAMFATPQQAGQAARVEHTSFLKQQASETWEPGSTLPSPGGGHVVLVPFSLELPQDLPPSVAGRGTDSLAAAALSGSIEYKLVVRGTRRGFMKKDVFVDAPINIVPSASHADVQARAMLASGPWTGAWNTLVCERSVGTDKTPVDGMCVARAELTIPNLDSYPAESSFPYRVRVVVQSPSCAAGTPAPALPALPLHPSELQLVQKSTLKLRIDGAHATSATVRALGGLGTSRASRVSRSSDVAPVWTPSGAANGSGVWAQAVCFDGTMSLVGAPTFAAHGIATSYALSLKLSLGGPHATLTGEWPVLLNTGLEAPPPPFVAAPLPAYAPTPLLQTSTPSFTKKWG